MENCEQINKNVKACTIDKTYKGGTDCLTSSSDVDGWPDQ